MIVQRMRYALCNFLTLIQLYEVRVLILHLVKIEISSVNLVLVSGLNEV